MYSRELTRQERREIRRLVKAECANYDEEYGCLPLDCECYMLTKWWTGAYCKYFQNAVLPESPALMASLADSGAQMRYCAVCGQPFPMSGKRAYCSADCQRAALRKQKREHMRKSRLERGNLPP